MLRAAAVLLVVAAAGTQMAPPGTQRSPDREQRVIHVAVEDTAGRPVRGLTAGDFQVLVEHATSPVVEASVNSDPLSLIVLVDATVSARWHDQPLDRLLTRLAASLGAHASIAIAAFGRRPAISDFVPAGSDIRRTVGRTVDLPDEERRGPSPIWDALYAVAERLDSVPPPRAILLLSDGRASGNVRGLDEVADRIAGRGIAVHVVWQPIVQQIYQGSGTAVIVRAGATLRRLARFSGGYDVEYPSRRKDAEALFASLGERITSLYRLTITVPGQQRVQSLHVAAKRPGLSVRAAMIIQ